MGPGSLGGFAGGSIAPLPPSHVLPRSSGPPGLPTNCAQVPSGAETLGSTGYFLCPGVLARLEAILAQPFKAAPPSTEGALWLRCIDLKSMVFLLVLWAPWVVLDFAGASGGHCENLVQEFFQWLSGPGEALIEHIERGELPEDTAVFFSPVMWGPLQPQ